MDPNGSTSTGRGKWVAIIMLAWRSWRFGSNRLQFPTGREYPWDQPSQSAVTGLSGPSQMQDCIRTLDGCWPKRSHHKSSLTFAEANKHLMGSLWHERVEKNARKKDGIHGTWVNKPWKKIHPEFHLGGISLTWYLHFQPQGSGPRSQLLMKPLKAFAHWRPPNNRIAVDGHGHRLRNNGNAPTALGLTVSTARTVGGCCLQGVFFRFG